MEGSGDLLALRGDLCFPIEVKSSKKSKLYLSGRTWDQYQAMVYEGKRCELMPLYAYRLKGVRGDSWRIFRVEVGKLSGRLGMLCRRIPPFPKTRNGKPFLDWEKGMPLHKFLALVCRKDEPNFSQLEQRIPKPENYVSNALDKSQEVTNTELQLGIQE